MPEEPYQQKPDDNSPSTKKKLNKSWILLFIILLLLFLVGFLAYFAYFKGETDTKEPAIPIESEKSSSPSATPITEEPAWQCNNQIYENERQGYKVCFESGWVKREFNPSNITVGFDPTNIPEASEYFGLIVVSVSSSDIDGAVSGVEESLESTSTSTTEVDGVSATQVSGTEPENLVNSGGPTIKTFFTRFDRLYVVTLASDTIENKQFYDDFLESWQFLDSASEPPPE